MEPLENLDTKVGKLYQRYRILVFPETGKSWSRTYIIRQIIPECGSIKRVDWSTLDPLFPQELLIGYYSEKKYLMIESK